MKRYIEGHYCPTDYDLYLLNKMVIDGKGEGKRTYCCAQCGLNHEARDFMRVMLLHLIDRFEENSKFVDFINDKGFLTDTV